MFATQNTQIFTRKWELILNIAHIHCVNKIFWQLSRRLELANFKIKAPYCGSVTFKVRNYGCGPQKKLRIPTSASQDDRTVLGLIIAILVG
jgi:hypothetical protein